MKRTSLFIHLAIPILVTLGVFAHVLERVIFGREMFANYVVGGYLFYAAPYLLWRIVAALAKLSAPVRHAGFMASSVALASIAAFWLGSRDPSGFPLQWTLYWPLAAVLQLVLAGGTAIVLRIRRMFNPFINTDTAR